MITKKKLLSLILIACVLVPNASCNRAGKGALIGGASGAGLGAIIGGAAGKGKGAGIGAAVGASVGASAGAIIGHYMDKKEHKLRQQVTNAEISRDGNQLTVKFDSGILFDVNRTELKTQSQANLKEFANVLKEYPLTELGVEGHTDNSGRERHNRKLSERRAEAVIAFLHAQGVEENRMYPFGYGESRPAAENSSEIGRQKNRRVEIKIVPNEELKKEAEAAAHNPS